MRRAAKRVTTRAKSFRLEPSNYEHLLGESKRLGLPWAAVLNGDLGFLRTGGLLSSLLARFRVLVEARRNTFRDELKTIIWSAAIALPPSASVSNASLWREAPLHETSANIAGPNLSYLMERCSVTHQDLTAVLNQELRFSRVFELTPELLGRVESHLEHDGVSVREWSSLEVLKVAFPLLLSPGQQEGEPRW